MKSSPSIWHLLHNVKLTVKILSIFVAFLENMNKNLQMRVLDPSCATNIFHQWNGLVFPSASGRCDWPYYKFTWIRKYFRSFSRYVLILNVYIRSSILDDKTVK